MKNTLKNRNIVKHEEHPFHILPPSYIPFAVAASLGVLIALFAVYMHLDTVKEPIPFLHIIIPFWPTVPDYWRLLGLIIILFSYITIWIWDICNEATYYGYHTLAVQQGLRYGMVLFIASEVMFFFSF